MNFQSASSPEFNGAVLSSVAKTARKKSICVAPARSRSSDWSNGSSTKLKNPGLAGSAKSCKGVITKLTHLYQACLVESHLKRSSVMICNLLGDFRRIKTLTKTRPYQTVFTNPPYFPHNNAKLLLQRTESLVNTVSV